MVYDTLLALHAVFTPSDPLLKSQFSSDIQYKSSALQLTVKSRLINHCVGLQLFCSVL